ncbi:hypothetical protein OEA41_004743 [Lepraria neglecta]|uniref:Uncharacterized protein n=1 Tax=Lepraria neglecta TaxID=209136 RepID=A0AAE0DG17_9LECA|nr:hypothetical protein OEA41_004743 [Lepraria neglecta]
MTTLHMQTTSHFEASATEDPMELTSDMDRRFTADEDIDIDLDLAADNHQDLEDEYMGEDVNVFTDPAPINEQDMYTANDDEMADDAYAEGSIAERSSVHDEDLEDATSPAPDLDEDTLTESQIEHTSDVSQGLSSNQEAKASHDHDLDYHELPSTSEADSGVILGMLPDGQTELVTPNDATSGLATQEVSQEFPQEHEEISRHDDPSRQEYSQELQEPLQGHVEKTSDDKISNYDYSIDAFAGEESYAPEAISDQPVPEEEPAALSKEEVLAPQNVAEEAQVEEYSTAPGEPTLQGHTYVHPVVIVYQDTEISLFPPVDQDEEHSTTYLLQDEQVAGEPINKLLGACRSVLGESITDHDELMINIDGLGLHFSEFTIESSNITLLQLIDVYINLHHNDGLENPPPLYMNLITKTTFSHRFEFLQNAIMEGKGFSQLRTSEVYYDDQQAEADGGQDQGVGDDLQHADGARDNEAEASEYNEGIETRDTHHSDDSRSNLSSLADPLQTADTATRASVPQSSVGDVGKEIDTAEAQLETKGLEEEVNNEGEESGPVNTNEEASNPSLLPFASQAQPQRPDELTLEDEDSIEYENEELAPGTSSGSSTLQGDILDTNVDQDQAETEDQKPSAQDGELEILPRVPDSTAEAENVENQGLTATAGTGGRGHYDFEGGLEDPDYPKEEEEDEEEYNSSDEYDDEWNEEAEGAQNERESQHDQSGPIDNVNDDQDEVPVQQENPSEEFDETQDQAAQKTTEENPRDGALSEIDTEDRLLSHSVENENEILSDPHHEEQININDVERGEDLAEDNSSLLYPNDDPFNPFTETKLELSDPASNVEQPQLDDDEISYEDEDDDEVPQEPFNAEHNVASSPGSLKRARSLHEDDDALEEDLQGAKRVRSS